MNPSYKNNFGAGGSPMVPTNPGGDIILNNEPEKKSRKGLIIGGAVAAVLVAIGVIALIITGGSSDEQGQSTELKNAYNSYANYVLLGEESEADLEATTIINQTPYFENLADNEKEEYIEKVEQRFEELKSQYDGEEDLAVLKSYFQDYVSITPFETSDLINLYVSNNGDKNKATSIIDECYTSSSDEESLNLYLEAERALDKAVIDEIESANAMGCIVSGDLVDGCYIETDEMAEYVYNAEFALMLSKDSLSITAMDVLLAIYEDVYGVEIEDEPTSEELEDIDEMIKDESDGELISE